MESLEPRYALSVSMIDLSQFELDPTYTTVDSPANHVVSTGSGWDGVAGLLSTHPSGIEGGTGVLLPTGQHVLTAAHLLTDDYGNLDVSAFTATFVLPGGYSTVSAAANGYHVHPNWGGTYALGSGYDLAIVELESPVSLAAERFDIYRETDEIGQIGDKAGFGKSGTGTTGDTLDYGTKREGANKYEALDTNSRILFYDFDNGTSANDAFYQYFGAGMADTGLGNDEVMTAPGDSGSPTLIDGQIAGITSFRTVLVSAADYLPGINSSFGEVGGDTRVSVFADWIDSVVDIVAPTVVDVTISGSSSLHDPYSFDDNSADGSGEQLRTVPVGGADTITLDFSEDVTVAEGDLTIIGLRSGNSPIIDDFTLTGDTATWTFTSAFAADQYLIKLSDDVVDAMGYGLDGEWVNPTSLTASYNADYAFPSGDGTAGGDFDFVFTILPADFNRDLSVGLGDYNIWLYSSGSTFGDGDANGDGSVGLGDYNIWLYSPQFTPSLATLNILADLEGSDYDVDLNDATAYLLNPVDFNGDSTAGDAGDDAIMAAFASFGIDLEVFS